MKGIVFDIKRFALHDGPGIRTTVFLKGCMLRCEWCCNPESREPEPEILFIDQHCTGCNQCMDVCPTGSHQATGQGHRLDFATCSRCGECVDVCVYNAVSKVGKLMDVDTVMEELERDREYYIQSGGGISLSGGDPLFQFPFSRALLTKAKAAGLHTCLETSGHADAWKIRELVPLVDLFLHDFKISDPDLHRKYTGVDNSKILSNLALLHELNAQAILRCPIIPGINDNDEHFSTIAGLSKKYTNIKWVEIMPYHDFGKEKYRQTGREYRIKAEVPTRSLIDTWIRRLSESGCDSVKIG